ncbi:YlxR family protein [Cyanobacterium sp. IPPAS B-1200]|uniref:YlxR family protein n=1 Tax=Cyanobacterium sp. IPPAS B-1200 TaxID=1562720 RepID=UPI0008526B4D|nr:YlxR family protein [Cyanobacterium sp. IPPAS B-1200]OEJ80219.1 nucleic acid-binding protein [Cyanobacterium sp. IPPAS B-1200]
MPPKNYRRCVSCGLLAPKNYFYQVVRNFPHHQITINEGMGRSAYVCPTLECITIAQKKKRLGRTLRTSVDPEIYDQLKSRC